MGLVNVKVGVHGNAKKRIARIILSADHLNGGYVATGWDRNEKYPDGTSVAQVALWNEFGSRNANGSVRSPARPFMRPSFQKNKGAILALQITVINDVLKGKITPEKALNILGYRMWSFVRAAILSNTPPPLAARTLAAKRRAGRPAVTLIDTRRMLDTLAYKIYIGGKGRPPMKEDSPASTGPTGSTASSGVTIKPQHPNGGGKLTQEQIKNIPRVMTPGEIKAEKKRLRDALKKAKPKAPGPSAKTPSPNGTGGKSPKVKVGGKPRKARAKPKPTHPGATSHPNTSGSTSLVRRKRSPGAKLVTTRGIRDSQRVKTKSSKPKRQRKAREQTPVKTTRGPRAGKKQRVREEKVARKKNAAARRSKSVFDKLEETILKTIIAAARLASRYGRSL